MWWFPAMAVLLVGLVTFVATALHVVNFGPAAAQRSIVETQEHKAASVERLAERDGEATAVQLPLAPAPHRAQDEIPIPPDARLIANTAHGDATAFSIRMVLEAAGGVADVLAFYRDELPKRGWEEVLMWRWRVEGAAIPVGELSAFCRGEVGPRFVVAAAPASPATSRVHIRIDSDTPGPCAASPAGVPSPERDEPFPKF